MGATPPVDAQPAPLAPPAPPPAGVVQPLSPARYQVTFTASAELRDKLERLQALVQEDLAAVIEAAVTEKLERLEAKRFAETKAPRKTLEETDTSASSRYMPAAVRRVVRKRDCGRCTFVNGQGRRCTERRGLEFHHDDPYGRGGGPQSIEYSASLSFAQFVFCGAGLRERRDGPVSAERQSCVRVSACNRLSLPFPSRGRTGSALCALMRAAKEKPLR